MKLKDAIDLKTGKNFSRNKGEIEVGLAYTYDDLSRDLGELAFSQKNKELREKKIINNINDEDHYQVSAGDVVFSFVSSTAGVVSQESEGKVLNQNFTKLIIKTPQIDPLYLCYCLNQSTYLKKQMAIEMQGSTLRRLTPSTLRELDIPIVDYSKQKSIGRTYFSLLKRQYLMEQQLDQEKKFILTLLDNQIKREANQEGKHDKVTTN